MSRWLRRPLLLVLLARLALALVYGQVVPPWEAYDEDGHFAYARYLAVHNRVTLDTADPVAAAIWEKFQPPLYYDLQALVLRAFPLGERFDGPARNPHFTTGRAGLNYALHPAGLSGAEGDAARALRAARALSALLSTLSVAAMYALARRLWPAAPRAAWAATLLFAFWPQWLFVGSMVSNDVLVTALSAAGLLLAVGLAADGFSLRRAVLLAVVVAAALLTKLNGLALVPTALLALVMGVRRRRAGRAAGGLRPAQVALGLAAVVGLVAGAAWLLTSLEFVTGQVLRLAVLREFVRQINPQGGGEASQLVTAALPYGFRTFVASFGWGNLEAFPWLYWAWQIGAGLAVAGGLVALGRRRASPGAKGRPAASPDGRSGPAAGSWPVGRAGLLLLGVHGLTLLALTVALAIAEKNVFLVPGRYLLPALPAVAALLVAGWRPLLRALLLPRWRVRAWQAVSLGLLVAVWATPLATLAPAYAWPRPLPAGASAGTPLGVRFGEAVELVGYRLPSAINPGDALEVELCWQARQPVGEDYTVMVELVGPDGQGYGRAESYPGGGNYPTSFWRAGQPFCDRYRMSTGPAIPAPALARVQVSLLRGLGLEAAALPAADAAGNALPDSVARLPLKVRPAPAAVPPSANLLDVRFGDVMRLTGYTLSLSEGAARVELRWEALRGMDQNYVVFVHLRDTPTHLLAQGDSEPRQAAYPTRLWAPGEVILDEHVVPLPAGPVPAASIYVGVVGPEGRLPAVDANGQRFLNDEVVLEAALGN